MSCVSDDSCRSGASLLHVLAGVLVTCCIPTEARSAATQKDLSAARWNRSNVTCTMDEFNVCMRKLSSITESEELSLASSRQELEILCGKWKLGHRCVDEHMSMCSDRLRQILYNDVVHGTRQVMNELCSPGRMQNDYLRLAPCFKSLFVDGGRCSQKYKSMIQLSKASTDLTEGANVEEGLRRTCCTFNEYVHCYYVHMPELCGEEGRDFFRTYTEKMSGPLIHEHCASYTYDSTCQNEASAVAPSVLLQLCLLSCLKTTLCAMATVTLSWPRSVRNGLVTW